MNRLRRSSFVAIALGALAAAPAHAQHGPALPDQQAAPVADIQTQPAASSSEAIADARSDLQLQPESAMPLGSPAVSEILPNLTPEGQPTDARQAEPESKSRFGDIVRTVAALLFVITLILALAWGVRRLAQKQGGLTAKLGAGGKAPSGVLEVLGRYPVGGKLTLVVLRFDRRVLLIAQGHGSNASMSTLCELDDPTDVASVLSRVTDSGGINAAFKEAIASAERDIETAMTPPAPVQHAPDVYASRHVTQSPEGDRLELLDDLAPPPQAEISPLRRRLEALRAGVSA